jgi:hypothetical protein
MSNNQQEALGMFIQANGEIIERLEKLLALSKNHWNIDPDEVHYGDVGDLRRVLQILKEI